MIKDCEATARNLDEGTEYDFRVMAVNEHGESKPLVTSEAIKAKHPFGRHSAVFTKSSSYVLLKFATEY